MRLFTLLTFVTAIVITNAFGQSGNYANRVTMHPIMDQQKGMVSSYVPLPHNWKVGPMAWTGPHEIRVELRKGATATAPQSVFYSVDQVLQMDMVPKLKQGGLRIDNIINLPRVAQKDQQSYAQYWKFAPTQDLHEARGIEMTETSSGKRALIVVHFMVSRSQFGSISNYYSHVLVADPAGFEEGKAALLFALLNTRSNPQYIAAHNQREQNRAQISSRAHQNKMAANQRHFQGMQKAQQTLSEVGDIYHQTWQNTNRISDRIQEKSVDGIWEREAAFNPYSGQQVKIPSGYKYYYMNQFGEWIGSNDEFYNPATDPNVNNYQWRPVTPARSGY